MAAPLTASERVLPRGATPEQEAHMRRHNALVAEDIPFVDEASKVVRPFAEYEKAGHVLFTGDFNFDSKAIKQEIYKRASREITTNVLVRNVNQVEDVRAEFSNLPSDGQLRVHALGVDPGFWARDALPIPVFVHDKDEKETLALVDARYYHNAEPDAAIASLFRTELFKTQFYFEGGNFVATTKGICATIRGRTDNIPDTVFQDLYGCPRMLRLARNGGIGHIDERVKFLSDTDAVTDRAEYRAPLEDAGFTVRVLPQASGRMETYVNSLLLNGKVFLPTYGRDTDAAAEAVYREFGLEVIPLRSNTLSNTGSGSIHCITMTYP